MTPEKRKQKIRELAQRNLVISAGLKAQEVMGISYEGALECIVLVLAEQNQGLSDKLLSKEHNKTKVGLALCGQCNKLLKD